MKLNRLIILMLILILPGSTALFAQFAGGSGTSVSPYLIASAAQLDSVRYYPDAYFQQTADIDLGVAPWNVGEGWSPIPFNGHYNGSNYNISHLYINTPESEAYSGLFNGGLGFSNVVLDSMYIYTGGFVVGGLTAQMNGGSISNCFVNGYIRREVYIFADAWVGGLIGCFIYDTVIDNCHLNITIISPGSTTGGLLGWQLFDQLDPHHISISNCSIVGNIDGGGVGGLATFLNQGLITNCTFNGSITASRRAGGLIGTTYDSYITNCQSSGTISINSDYRTGGLMSSVVRSTVLYCSSSSDIIGSGQYDSEGGGLIGLLDSSIIRYCFSTGNVTNSDYGGGFIGVTLGNCTITDSYSTANVSNGYYLSGFVGYLGNPGSEVTIEHCYSLGSVTGNDCHGAFCGYNELTPDVVSNSYWDTQTSGMTYASGGGNTVNAYPRTTDDMTYPYTDSTFVGWDFANVWQADTDYSHNNGYPYLRAYTAPDTTHIVLSAPQNVQVEIINNTDVRLSWTPVMQTVTGAPVTVTGYKVYRNITGNAFDEAGYIYLDSSATPSYTHIAGAGIPHAYYRVTAVLGVQ